MVSIGAPEKWVSFPGSFCLGCGNARPYQEAPKGGHLREGHLKMGDLAMNVALDMSILTALSRQCHRESAVIRQGKRRLDGTVR